MNKLLKMLNDRVGLILFTMFLLAFILAIVSIFVAKADAQEQYKPVFLFGKTSHTIVPYYEFKPTVAAFTVKAKGKHYCPPKSDDYQCPADYDPIKYINEPERKEKQRKFKVKK